jgi:FAD/FMN-containing dehydrogenase
MSSSTLPTSIVTSVPAPPSPRSGRALSIIASLSGFAALGSSTALVAGSASSGAAAGWSAGPFALGALLALLQGATASDRRGRRRFSLIGLSLVGAGVALTLIGVLPLAAFCAGIGSVMVAFAADGRLRDAGTSQPVAIVLALAGVAGGTAAVAFVGSWATIVLSILAVALAVVAPETPLPRTPVFVLPGLPTVDGRGAALVAMAGLGFVFGTVMFGWVGALVAAVAMSAFVAVYVAKGTRVVRGSGVVEPGTREYRTAVKTYDATVSLAPRRAAITTTPDEVADAIEAARREGLGVSVHSTGHAAAWHPSLDDSLLLRVKMTGGVTVDVSRRLVRIPAGTAWADVVAAVAPHGLAVPHGSSGHVGVVGYLTRGGLSAYGRTTGVAANSLESVELVLADGRRVVASRTQEPELFWAVRGGGGGFGVVTAVTVRAFVPGSIVTGAAAWELRDAAPVAEAWARWTALAPSSITTSLRVLTIPPLPGMPFALSRRPLLVIDGTAVDTLDVSAEEAASELLTGLRAAGPAVMDTWRTAGVEEVPLTHMDPPFGPAHSTAHGLVGGESFRDGDQAERLVRDFVTAATNPDSALMIAELRQLGGALADAPVDAGAVGHYRGAFGWLGLQPHGKTGPEQAASDLDRAWAAMSDWSTGYTAPTLAVERERPALSFPAEVARRAQSVRSALDPTGLFDADVAPGARI